MRTAHPCRSERFRRALARLLVPWHPEWVAKDHSELLALVEAGRFDELHDVVGLDVIARAWLAYHRNVGPRRRRGRRLVGCGVVVRGAG